jgi:autotransporter-associated beta strand protein
VDFAGPINANNNEIWSFQTFAGTPASTPIVHYGRISSATDGWKKNGNALQVGDANAATVNGLIGSGPIIFDLADNTAQRGALLELSNTDQFTGTLTIRGVVGGDSAAANNAFNVSRVELARDANHAFDWVFENAVQVSTLAGLNLSQNIDGNITLLAGADVAFQGRPDNLPGTLTLGGANKANETLTIHAGAQANMDVGFRTDKTAPAGVHLDMKTLILDGGVLRFRQSVAGLTPRAGDNMQINGNVIGAGSSSGPDALFDVQIDVGTNPGQLSMGAAAGFVVNGSGFGGLRVEGTSTRLAALLTGTRIGGITGTGGVFTVAPTGAMTVSSAPAALNNPVRLGLASSGTGATITAGAVANDLANWAGLVVKGSSGTGTTTVNLGANQSLTSGPGVTTTLDVLAGTLNLGAFNLSVEGTATLWTGSITGTTGRLTAGSFELQSGSVSAILAGSGPLAKTTAGAVTITSANTFTGGSTLSAGTVIAGNNAVFGATAAQTVTFNGGSLASNNDGRVLANNLVVNNVAGNQITGGNSVTLTGAATGAGTLAVNLSNSAKTVTINPTSANSFAPGGLDVATGTMLLGSSDRIGDATNVVLSGGRFATGGFSDTLGDLTLSANSTIDFGTSDNSSLRFSSANWTGGDLTILNWTGNPYTGPNLDHLYVTGSVSQSFLDRVTFAGYAPGAIAFDRGGGLLEIQPVPEPGTLGGALALVALVLVRERRRIGGWAASFSQSIQPQKRAARTVLSITKR